MSRIDARNPTVGVDVESDCDLRNTAQCRGDVREPEVSEPIVVFGHDALALVHHDVHAGLVVLGGGELLLLLGGDGGVAGYDDGHHASVGFEARAGGAVDRTKPICP